MIVDDLYDPLFLFSLFFLFGQRHMRGEACEEADERYDNIFYHVQGNIFFFLIYRDDYSC